MSAPGTAPGGASPPGKPCDDAPAGGTAPAGPAAAAGSGPAAPAAEGSEASKATPSGDKASEKAGDKPDAKPDAKPATDAVATVTPGSNLPKTERPAGTAIYVSTGSETATGKIFQVDEGGNVVGKIGLPFTATGIALHPVHGLILAVPRDGGKILKIDDGGRISAIVEKDPSMPHPVNVAVATGSDSILAADNMANALLITTIGVGKTRVYQRFEGQRTSQDMSIAVTKDRHILYSSGGKPGVFRYEGGQATQILTNSGGVAADPNSPRWAAAQDPNLVYIYEGDQMLKKLRLPPGKNIYRSGLMAFTPTGSLCVAVRDSDEENGEVWLIQYDLENDDVKSLFPCRKEQLQDFVIGHRSPWDRQLPSAY